MYYIATHIVGTRIAVDNPVNGIISCTLCRGVLWRGYYSLFNMLTRTPDLYLLHKLCEQLNRSLAQAENSYLEFEEDCKAAIKSCDEAAQICGRKANEARGKKLTTRIVGGTASAIAGAVAATAFTVSTGGLGALALGAAAGTVGVAGAVTTHCIAREYAKSEESFRSIRREFDDLLRLTRDFNQRVTHVHNNLEAISTHVNDIAYWMKHGHGRSVLLVHDALGHLNEACSESLATTSRCRKGMKCKIEELKEKCNRTDP